jgi:uncharacterized protein YecT (DUF1311 family)
MGGAGGVARECKVDEIPRFVAHAALGSIRSLKNDLSQGAVMRISSLLALAAVVLLAACGKPQATCSDADAQAALQTAIRDNLEKSVLAKSKDSEGKQYIGSSKIRAAIADLKLIVENIRTTKEDPNSTKKFCTGNLKVVFGTQDFTDADKTREIAGMPNVSSAADSAGIDKGVDYLKSDLDYSVQPTDDGSKVVAEFDAADGKLDLFGEVLAASLLRPILENRQRIDQENTALAEKQAQDALNAANEAAIEQASVTRKSADQALMAVWNSLDTDTKHALLPEQRAWIKRKDTSCKVQGLQSSTDPTEQQVATQNCVTQETQSRIYQLQNYMAAD